MYKSLVALGLLGLFAGVASAADQEVDSCEQIRVKIQAKTGVVASIDVDLLRQLPLRPECRFSAAEVYRAAYGDRPLPERQADRYHAEREHHRHDDD